MQKAGMKRRNDRITNVNLSSHILGVHGIVRNKKFGIAISQKNQALKTKHEKTFKNHFRCYLPFSSFKSVKF